MNNELKELLNWGFIVTFQQTYDKEEYVIYIERADFERQKFVFKTSYDLKRGIRLFIYTFKKIRNIK